MSKDSAPTEQNITQTNLPDYVRPQYERLLQRAESQSIDPYQGYGGQRIADINPDTLQAYDITRGVAGAGIAGLPEATALAQSNVQAGQDLAAGAEPTQFSPFQEFTGPNVDKYMSPYMQQVLDVQKDQAQRQFDEQGAARAAQAVEAGAFGGSRQAVQEGVAERGLLDRMADIQATGQQQAFESAQGAFGDDRTARFGQEQAQADENRAGQQAQLQALGFSAEQAQQMVGLGETGRAAEIQGAQLLESIGRSQEQYDQMGLDTAYEDFLRQSAYPEQQLQMYSSILRGVPTATNTTTTTMAPSSPVREALGAGLTGIGLYRGLSG